MGKHTEIRESKLLIGEGIEETRFFAQMLKHLGISGIQLLDYGGKDKLKPFLAALPTMPGFDNLRVLAVTRDADDNVANAFESIRDGLIEAQLTAPRKCGVIVGKKPAIGVFLLPDSRSPGMLETACLNSAQDDPAMPCVDDYFECVKNKAKRVPNNMSKAKIHAWLASQSRPDLRLGEAAENGLWHFDDSAFQALRDFLKTI